MNRDGLPIVQVSADHRLCPSCEESWHFDAIPIVDKCPVDNLGYVELSGLALVGWELVCRRCGAHRYDIEYPRPVPLTLFVNTQFVGPRVHEVVQK